MHIHRIEDESGDLVDIVPFCSDYCHRTWGALDGIECLWDGCHETEIEQKCEHCGTLIEAS